MIIQFWGVEGGKKEEVLTKGLDGIHRYGVVVWSESFHKKQKVQ